MKYEKACAEIVEFEDFEIFMKWSSGRTSCTNYTSDGGISYGVISCGTVVLTRPGDNPRYSCNTVSAPDCVIFDGSDFPCIKF